MVDRDFDPLCKQAEVYYYDILSGKGDSAAPNSVIKHIDHCDNCREQLKRLNNT